MRVQSGKHLSKQANKSLKGIKKRSHYKEEVVRRRRRISRPACLFLFQTNVSLQHQRATNKTSQADITNVDSKVQQSRQVYHGMTVSLSRKHFGIQVSPTRKRCWWKGDPSLQRPASQTLNLFSWACMHGDTEGDVRRQTQTSLSRLPLCRLVRNIT